MELGPRKASVSVSSNKSKRQRVFFGVKVLSKSKPKIVQTPVISDSESDSEQKKYEKLIDMSDE